MRRATPCSGWWTPAGAGSPRWPSATDARALAGAAGLSAWRREALVWAVTHDAASVPGALSLSELAWAGDPQTAADRAALDAWGTARLAATGELATRAPRRRGWEGAVAHDARAGLATSVGDLNLRIAAFLAAHHCRRRWRRTCCRRRRWIWSIASSRRAPTTGAPSSPGSAPCPRRGSRTTSPR